MRHSPSMSWTACEQVGQVGPACREVVAVAVDDLAQQRHLAHALGDQAAHLAHDLVQRPAALDAAAEGDDAEGAGVRAAVDDGHVGGHRRLAAERQMPNALQRSPSA